MLITLFCFHKTTGEVWDPWRLVILVLNALFCLSSYRWGLRPVETINSGHNVAVVNAQNHRWGLGPIETCSSGAKVAVLNAKNVGEVWEPLRLEIPVLKSLFCLQKPNIRAGPIDTSYSDANHVVLNAQNDKWCLGHIETSNSDSKVAVLPAKTTDEGWDP